MAPKTMIARRRGRAVEKIRRMDEKRK